jgi:hypothetical protein
MYPTEHYPAGHNIKLCCHECSDGAAYDTVVFEFDNDALVVEFHWKADELHNCALSLRWDNEDD